MALEKQTRSLHEHHIEQTQTPKDYAYQYWKHIILIQYCIGVKNNN